MNKFTIQQLQQMRESEDVPLMRVGEELKPMSDAMYLKILQESEPDFSEKICEGLLISAQDGFKLSDRYYEIAKNVGTVENIQKNDTVNVPVNDTVNLSQLTERQRKIYDAIKNVPVSVPINVPIKYS